MISARARISAVSVVSMVGISNRFMLPATASQATPDASTYDSNQLTAWPGGAKGRPSALTAARYAVPITSSTAALADGVSLRSKRWRQEQELAAISTQFPGRLP